MDQDIEIINSNLKYEKLKIFFKNNKKKIAILFFLILILIFGYFFYQEFQKKNKQNISENYNNALTEFKFKHSTLSINIIL